MSTIGDIIRVSGVHKVYRGRGSQVVHALKGVDLRVARGQIVGVLGPNGAGKTTLLEILTGVRREDEGEVLLFDELVRSQVPGLFQRIGIQFQSTAFFEKLRVRELVEMFATFYSNPWSVDELLSLVKLQSRDSSFPRQLSGGEAQRFALAMALVGGPELLVLDEPTTGIDAAARREIWDLLRRVQAQGVTILLSTHNMTEAETLCDEVIVLVSGTIVARGAPLELIREAGFPYRVHFSCTAGAWSPAMLDATGILSVSSKPDSSGREHWELLLNPQDESIETLTRSLGRLRNGFSGFEVDRPTLEDFYLSVAAESHQEVSP